MFPSRSEFDGFTGHWKLSWFYFDVEGMFFPCVAKLIFSIALALRYAGHCPQWLLPPCGEGAACFSRTLWGCGNLDATIISRQKTYAKLADVVAICMPSGLRPVVFVKRDIDFLEKIRAWETEIYNSAHFPHRRTGFFEPSCCWITRRFDVLFGLNGFHSRSSYVFVMFWSCCIFSRTVLRFPALQPSRQVRRGN